MRKHTFFICMIVIAFGLFFNGMWAQEDAQGPNDPAELEAFLDGVMKAHLSSHDIPGATLSVVKDGKLLFAKGYGYADVEKRKKVDPAQTLFRTGSTGKLFTWTAVMQLVEQGKLDLDADVNTYLKEFKVPETFPQPITMTHLLTHTPGLEDSFLGMAAREPEDTVPLGKWLAEHMPARVRPPGQFTAYSNYGTALAGYIVEVISGIPYEQYVEEHIFKPLDMTHTTCSQPPAGELEKAMSVGYQYENGWHKERPFEIFRSMGPAGLMSTTAIDMANFMMAHLDYGKFNDIRILQEETAKRMQTRLFSHDPRVNGNAHGFWENRMNGLRIIEHGGDTFFFHTLMALIPEKNMGLFVSYNSAGTGGIPRYRLLKAFLDRYYPAPGIPLVKPGPDAKEKLQRYTGNYSVLRRSYTTLEKLGGLVSTLKVSITGDGYLLVDNSFGGGAGQWVLMEPLVFRRRGGLEKLVFRQDSQGRITHMFIGRLPYAAGEKMAGHEAPFFHIGLMIVCCIFFLTTLVWPLRAISRFLCRQKKQEEKSHRVPRVLAVIMSLLYLFFLLGLMAVTSDPLTLAFGVPPLLKTILIFPIAAAVLTIGMLVYTFLAWKKKYWTVCARLYYTLVALASLAFIWFLNYWNLLGFNY